MRPFPKYLMDNCLYTSPAMWEMRSAFSSVDWGALYIKCGVHRVPPAWVNPENKPRVMPPGVICLKECCLLLSASLVADFFLFVPKRTSLLDVA